MFNSITASLWVALIIAGLLPSCARGGSNGTKTNTEAADTDAIDDDSELEETLTFTGTLSLGAVDESDKDNLTVGDPIDGATVFLAGHPNDVATTDATGAFTLAITVKKGSNLIEPEYSVVTWYETPNDHTKFGKMTTATLTGDSADMGNIELSYTRSAHIFPIRESEDTAIKDNDCLVEFPDYGDKIPVTHISGADKHIADYLPPGDYLVKVECPGFVPKTQSITMISGNIKGKWDPFVIKLDAE